MSFAKDTLMISLYKDDGDLLVDLRQVFERCRQYRIAFNPKKSKIGLDHSDWVGHQLDADGIHFSAEQLSEVAEFPTPVGAKGLRSFLGLANYFRDQSCASLCGHGASYEGRPYEA